MTALKSVLSSCKNLRQLEDLLVGEAQMTIGACGGRRFTNEKLGIGSISLSDIFKRFQELKQTDSDAEQIRTIVTKLNSFDQSGDTLLLSQNCIIRLLTAIRRLFGNCCFDFKASLAQARTELPPLTPAQKLWNLAERYSKASGHVDLDEIEDVEVYAVEMEVQDFSELAKIDRELSQFKLSDLPQLCTEIQKSHKSLDKVFSALFFHSDINLSNLFKLLSLFSDINPVKFLDRFCEVREIIILKRMTIRKKDQITLSYTKLIIDHEKISENENQIPTEIVKYLSEKLIEHAKHVAEVFKYAVENDEDLSQVPCGIGLSFSLKKEQEDGIDAEGDVIDDEDILNARNVMRALLSDPKVQKIPHLVALDLNEFSEFDESDVELLQKIVNSQPYLDFIKIDKKHNEVFKKPLSTVINRSNRRNLLDSVKNCFKK